MQSYFYACLPLSFTKQLHCIIALDVHVLNASACVHLLGVIGLFLTEHYTVLYTKNVKSPACQLIGTNGRHSKPEVYEAWDFFVTV